MKQKVGVIGAGPAGIMAAGKAAEDKNNEVVILEKNEKIGKKLFITGKGRCNITNAAPLEDFFDNIVTNHFFMYSSLYTFTNEDIMSLLEKYGVQTKVERGNRVFPVTDKSSDVIRSFGNYLKERNVAIHFHTDVEDIKKVGNQFSVTTNKGIYVFDKVVLATGGKSYSVTGSTGVGYSLAESLGHHVITPKPSLVPIRLSNKWLREVQGLSLRNVSLKTYHKNRLVLDEFGDLQFAHFGITGPIVLTTSSQLHKYDKKDLKLYIDFKPALNEEVLSNRLLRDFDKYQNKQFKNSLNDLLPQSIIPVMIEKSGIDPEKKVNQITKEERFQLVRTIKKFSLKFDGLMPLDHAIITSGGIDVKEINSSTMESMLVPGLFFAGELIDVDALTGGFNLQIAYSTGYLAGSNI